MPQEYPLRLTILRSLTKCLTSITPQNGYVSDLSDAVFRGRIYFGENDPLPMVSILEPPLPPDPIVSPWSATTQLCTWDLLIQGFVKDDPINPLDPAHVLLADVRKALAFARMADMNGQGGILGAWGKVRDLDLGSPVVRPSDDISSKAYFYLPITLKIAENLADPYADFQQKG